MLSHEAILRFRSRAYQILLAARNFSNESSASPTHASRLTHLDDSGRASMVNVGSKAASERTATACATVNLGRSVFKTLLDSMQGAEGIPDRPSNKKGDVFTVAQLAGIMGAKRTPDLIPLCHTVPLAHVSVLLQLDEAIHGVQITATASTGLAQTGVEMEALTAASVAALTVYDMCKAGSKAIEIDGIRLLSKTGGKSGDYKAE